MYQIYYFSMIVWLWHTTRELDLDTNELVYLENLHAFVSLLPGGSTPLDPRRQYGHGSDGA